MRYVKDATGRFSERPHYTPDEIEAICSKFVTNYRHTRYNGNCSYPIITRDLERLIELNADLDLYVPLDDSVEGLTDFSSDKPIVKIAEHLGENAATNRLRATLAHELSHLILHTSLYNAKKLQCTLDLIDHSCNNSITYRDSSSEENYSDWLEWQAWYATGAILMPKADIMERVQRYVIQTGLVSPINEGSPEATDLIAKVSNKYQVSNQLAALRLKRLLVLGIPSTDQHKIMFT